MPPMKTDVTIPGPLAWTIAGVLLTQLFGAGMWAWNLNATVEVQSAKIDAIRETFVERDKRDAERLDAIYRAISQNVVRLERLENRDRQRESITN